MSTESGSSSVLEPIPARDDDDELEALADDLRDLADRVDPDDWMHDRWGRPL